MFSPIGNSYPALLPFMPGTFPVQIGQWLTATRQERRSFPDWKLRHHVAVVTQAAQTATVIGNAELHRMAATNLRGPKIVQAMPRGAEEIEIGPEHWTPEHIYIRPAYGTRWYAYMPGDELRELPGQGAQVAEAARRYIGTPYSFLDYAAIYGVHLGIKGGWLRDYVRSTGHQIYSQLADQAMSDAGWHVFTDGRLPQDVTPAALYRQMMRMPGQHLVPGGQWEPNAVSVDI